MYISFIRQVLEYCDSVWDNSSSEMKKLDAIYIEVASRPIPENASYETFVIRDFSLLSLDSN